VSHAEVSVRQAGASDSSDDAGRFMARTALAELSITRSQLLAPVADARRRTGNDSRRDGYAGST
jgi:hypothetical protein